MNEFNKDLADTVLRRIDAMSEEIAKLQRAVNAIIDGKPFDEAFNDELYSGALEDKRDLEAKLILMMEHILMLKYSVANCGYNGWLETYRRTKNEIIGISEWRTEHPNRDLISYMKEQLSEWYKYAVRAYIHASKEYYSLKPNMDYIPKECPWTLEDLVGGMLSEPLNMLPDPDSLTVQMMLYPQVCVYRYEVGVDEEAYGKQCGEWCEHFQNCVSKYTEMRYGCNTDE